MSDAPDILCPLIKKKCTTKCGWLIEIEKDKKTTKDCIVFLEKQTHTSMKLRDSLIISGAIIIGFLLLDTSLTKKIKQINYTKVLSKMNTVMPKTKTRQPIKISRPNIERIKEIRKPRTTQITKDNSKNLSILKKHTQGEIASITVYQAAIKTFTKNQKQFLGKTPSYIKNTLGKPLEIIILNDHIAWLYKYNLNNTDEKQTLHFSQNGKVVKSISRKTKK